MGKVKMTSKEYADKRKVSLQAVTNAIRNSYDMPSVVKVEKFGRFYLLTVKVDDKGDLL